MTYTRYLFPGFMLLAGFGIRAFFAIGFFGNYDTESFYIVAEIVRKGGNVYTETFRYNYSPVWFNLLGIADHLARALDIPMHVLVRLGLSAIDLANAGLVGLIAERLRARTGTACAVMYALNPGAILLTGLHGQFETLAMLPILVGVLLYLPITLKPEGPKPTWGRSFWVFIGLLALGVVIKHNTVFIVWPLLVWAVGLRRAVLGMAIIAIAFLSSFLPYWAAQSTGILANVFMYRSAAGLFGLSWFVPSSLATLAMVLAVFATPLIFRPATIVHVMTLGVLVWLTTAPGFGIQYMTLFLLSAAAEKRYRWPLFVVGVGVAIWESYFVSLSIETVIAAALYMFVPLALWVVMLSWLVVVVRQSALRWPFPRARSA
jgi:hypothetical protein